MKNKVPNRTFLASIFYVNVLLIIENIIYNLEKSIYANANTKTLIIIPTPTATKSTVCVFPIL